jgi:hypothetical protein
MDKNICVVLLCNKEYFDKFIYTSRQLITNGNYKGDICLVIGDDLYNNELLNYDFIKNNNIIIKHFPNINFTNDFLSINNDIKTDGRHLTKKFQWHKLHLFNTFFKKWNYIFYIDCGMTIFSDISPILNEITENTLLAHSDAYPTYEWKLHCQFCKSNKEYYDKVNNTYNLDIDYFQTTMLLFDTKIIHENTFNDLLYLTYQYPISRTNEQGIIALYFTNIKPLFKQIKIYDDKNNIYLYDFMSRNKNNKYIMLKRS